jgi:acetoin:2,6-dichlorophenolindophenol oxidoreductase subunit beta
MTNLSLADRRTGSHLVAETFGDEMRRDPSIIVLGEDVAELGGVFGATRRLLGEFGPERVLDTPISETAFVGAAVGSAQAGLRPVVELMFVDFLGVCFDQIANQMAKSRYMSGGRVGVPLVLRSAVGCIGAAAQHSQVLSATFAHIPGLKVAFPASPGDLRGMLVTAIRDDDPVIFLEHKWLLKTRVGELPFCEDLTGDPDPVPFGLVRRLRDGADITIVAAGWMVQLALQAAASLADEGIQAGVVDLRTLVPLDRDGLAREAQAAPTLLVVDDDYADYGMCGELIASVAERLGRDGPRMARHALDVPIPANRALEEAVVPSAHSIAGAVRGLVGVPA